MRFILYINHWKNMCWTLILYQMSIKRILCQTLAHISLMPLPGSLKLQQLDYNVYKVLSAQSFWKCIK